MVIRVLVFILFVSCLPCPRAPPTQDALLPDSAGSVFGSSRAIWAPTPVCRPAAPHRSRLHGPAKTKFGTNIDVGSCSEEIVGRTPVGKLNDDLFIIFCGAFSLKLISKEEIQIQPIFDDTMKGLRSSVGPILHQIC
jgi:hypothetical protein